MMEFKDIEREVEKLKVKQNNKLERAYRLDERIKTLKEFRHEMIMFEHRKDITSHQGIWLELKEFIDKQIKKR